jgi:hypothetical protein
LINLSLIMRPVCPLSEAKARGERMDPKMDSVAEFFVTFSNK